MIRHTVIVAIASAGLLAGCDIPPGEYAKCPEQFLSLEELTVHYNANARKVPKLWARVSARVQVKGLTWGSAGKKDPSNGLLLLSKAEATPTAPNFVLIGKETGMDILRLGTDARTGLYYWWLQIGNNARAYYGRQAMAGAPGVEAMAIDPVHLMAMLGVTELPRPEAGKMPAALMQMRGEPLPAYVVRYVSPQPVTGHLKLWREIRFRWDKEGPSRPYRIRLFDAKGLCRVWADLSDYESAAVGEGVTVPPELPTYIRMTWPEIKGVQLARRLEIRLKEMSTVKKFRQSAFTFNPPPGAGVPIQVDAIHGEVAPTGETR